MKDFRDLKVWQKAHDLALSVCRSTRHFPTSERYGLTSQLRRGAVSVASNIAEGCGRGGDADFARCLQIALGSASELEYQLLLVHELGLVTQPAYRSLHENVVEVKRMLASLIQKLRS